MATSSSIRTELNGRIVSYKEPSKEATETKDNLKGLKVQPRSTLDLSTRRRDRSLSVALISSEQTVPTLKRSTRATMRVERMKLILKRTVGPSRI